MKRPLLILEFSIVLILVFIFGYIVGSIRGARLENLNGQIDCMNFAFAVASATRTGNSNIIYPDSRSIVSSIYQGVTNDSWIRNKLLIPIVKWDKSDTFPEVSFGVGDAGRSLTAQAGKFLRDTQSQSNRLSTTNQSSSLLSPGS